MSTIEKPSKETLENWRNDPNNWKYGIFYYNKADNRIFPPKRNIYMGWTINFAKPSSIIAFVVLLLIIFGITFICSNQ